MPDRADRASLSERAKRYATNVVAGRILACEYVRKACKRHLDDLKSAESDPDFPYYFDASAADELGRFVELLPHVKGKWAKDGELLVLEPWQCFVVGVPFGWKRSDDDTRRFRRAYLEIPRKNGKSSLTAALGLYMFAADGEFGAEVYSGAGSEKQAWEVFGPARLMAKRTPQFTEHYGVQVNAKNLNILATNSKFEPIIGKPGDGASPSFSITDEYHEHDTEEQLDTMLTGMGSREAPMAWVITTAGTDTEGPCYALRSEAVETVGGLRDGGGDELFSVIYTIDEDDDWTSVEALEKANPNIDVSVGRDYLLAQQRDAVHYPRKQSTFKTKHLNVWTAAASPFFNLEKWNRSADESLTVEQFAGEPCWIGLDLASKKDLAAAVKLFRREIDGEEHYYTFGRYYLPESRTEDPSLRHYGGWARGGYLVPTPGNITDYDAIEADLKDDADRFRIVEIGFDPWNATQVVTHLIDHGVSCAEVPQNVRYMSEPMKWIDALIDDGRFHHNGNPVLAWAIGNVTAQVDRNDNVYPRKEREEKKIDPAVALIIAMSVALRAEEQAASPYESHGIRMVG